MSLDPIHTAIDTARYLQFKYHKPGEKNPHTRYVWPRRIRDGLLIADEFTPQNLYEGKPKTFKVDLIRDAGVLPEGWSPAFEWAERSKHVDGDMVVEDVTTLEDKRKGCVAKAVVRKRRRGLMRWLFGD
jgi:hypothetical protein